MIGPTAPETFNNKGCTKPGTFSPEATQIRRVAPNIYRHSIRKCRDVTYLALRISRWLLEGKGKVHPRRAHEGPDGENMYSSTLSLTWALDGGGSGYHNFRKSVYPGDENIIIQSSRFQNAATLFLTDR
jgi:hypothetical protein